MLGANHLILDGIQSSNKGKIQGGANVLGEGAVVLGKSAIRGPAIIDRSCRLEPGAHVEPYTAIRDGCQVSLAEVDDYIVMDGTTIEVERKLVRSMIGKGSKILSANGLLPKGDRLVVGENTTIYL
jgi:NDP-sugar pyrophosphorylase family protein